MLLKTAELCKLIAIRRFWHICLFLFGTLLVIWSMPGTLGLRNVLLLLLFMASGTGFYLMPKTKWRLGYSKAIFVLLLLSAWLLFNTLIFSSHPSSNFHEFKGQWVTSLIFCISAFFLGTIASTTNDGSKKILILVFWVLFAQILFHDVIDLLYYWETGKVPLRADPYSTWPIVLWRALSGWQFGEMPLVIAPDKFSYVLGLFNTLILSEICYRVISKKKFMPQSNGVLCLALALSMGAGWTLSLRNSYFELTVLLLSVAIALFSILLKTHKVMGLTIAVICGALIIALTVVSLQTDSRWSRVVESARLAWSSEGGDAWLDPSSASSLKLDNGALVDNAYYRIAWAKEGLSLIMENPFGTGYDRNAFGAGINKKYSSEDRAKGGHSHSGLIDFTVANGIPGLALWLIFNLMLLGDAMSDIKRRLSPIGFLLLFLVVTYNVRSLVDSTIRDHMLQQYLFFTTLSLTLIVNQGNKNHD